MADDVVRKTCDVLGVKAFWLVPVDGFDPIVCFAESSAKARYAVFQGGQDAGYFDSFRTFLSKVGRVEPLTNDEALSRVGGHLAVGETRQDRQAFKGTRHD